MLKIKSLLLLAIFSFTLISCNKHDWKHFFDKPTKTVISKKGLPLSGKQEVPVKDVPAKGKMDVSYDKKTKTLTYSISWKKLSDNPVGAHIHGTAPRGVNAGIKHGFTDLIPKTTSGEFTNHVVVDEIAIKEDSLLLGYYYLNIHTPANPGGEIRGQIEFD